MTKQLKKQIQNQSQSGRSMVEMLGVLAIIAILSIGGIVGYKLAMNYYQADQIANEINLMRNDLKVKYALGNEELLLGDPYDDTPENENYSGHLSTQYDRYPVDYDCIIRGNKDSKNELYNCREADAYYIAVGNISKGVCKPLTTLVAAMDGRLEMDINGISYTEGDSCTSDENNEIYVEFDAADVNGNYDSNRPEGWCAKNEDCEGLSTPVCDKDNNECVECMKNADCVSNICRKDYTCGECTKDSDCVNPRPICDTESATCIGCVGDDECQKANANKPVCDMGTGACCDDPFMTWNGSECVCPENYAKSETSSGKAICLPYCEQEVGLIIMTDRSGSMGNTKTDEYNNVMRQIKEAQQKLHIPEDIYSAVYFTGCSSTPSGEPCPYRAKMDMLPYGKHSAAEIKSAMDPTWTYQTAYSTFFAAFNEDITPMCKEKGRKLKLIIILFWDVDGTDVQRLNALSQYCDTVVYNISVNGTAVSTNNGTYTLNARETFKLSEFKESDIDLINDGIHQEGCVEKN